MSDDKQGLRALPPTLLLAFTARFALLIATMIVRISLKEPWGALRFQLTTDGIGFAVEVLMMYGAFELARRLTGRAALGVRIASFALLFQVVIDILWSVIQCKNNLWEHRWVYTAAEYTFWAGWFVVPIGLAIAMWRDKRVLAIILVAVSVLAWPPQFIAKSMYSWLPEGDAGVVIQSALVILRYAFMLAGFAVLARGQATIDRAVAASGLRLAAKSLWLRLIAAAAVPLITLMAIAGRGSSGSLEMLKLATLSALVVNIFAFTQLGIGALRTARASVPELGRWAFVVGGSCALWAAGVMLGQLPWFYKLLYGNDRYGGDLTQDYTQALSLALPLVATAGLALLAVAISGLAARTGNEALRAEAQAKGAGFVALSLVAMAITAWMLPKASSMSNLAMLMLLALGASIVAIVMMARLLGLAAADVERQVGLPSATVVSDGT